MIDAVEFFTSVMKLPAIVTLLGNDTYGDAKVYWTLAEENTEPPFLVFKMEDLGPVSKGSQRMRYVVDAYVYADDLTAAVRIGSEIRAIVKENFSSRVYDRGAKADYTDTEAKEAYMLIKYEFSQ